MRERGIDLSHENVRFCWHWFGQMFAVVHSNLMFLRVLAPDQVRGCGVAGYNHFNLEHHINDRNWFKENRQTALAEWRQLAA